MIIYEFSTWGAWGSENKLFSVNEIEVEEKPKSYTGKGTRVLKEDIDKLTKSYGHRMYRLTNEPKLYIEAMIEHKKERIKILESSLQTEKAELGKWEVLQRKGDNK